MTTEMTATHGTVAGKKDILVNDLKGVVSDADELLKEVARSTAEGFAVARTKVEGKLGEAKSGIHDARIAVTNRAVGAADATQEYVREHPWKVLGIAAAVGLITGLLIRK